MSDAGQASRGVKLTLGGQAAKFLIQLASTVVLARLLSPDDFGVFAMVAALVGFASLLGDFGLSTAAIQAESISMTQRSNLFWISSGLGVVLYLLFYFGAPLIEQFYGEPGLIEVVQLMSLGFLLAAVTSQFTALLTRNLKFGRLALIEVASQGVALIAAVGMAAIGFGYWALVAQQIVLAAVKLCMTFLFARWVPRLPGRAPMRGLVVFAANSFGVQALSYVSGNVDDVVLGRTAGPDALGLYNRAFQLFKIPIQQIAAPLTRVALPILSRHQNARTTMSRYVVGAQAGVAYTLGAVLCLAAAMSDPVIELALGPQWGAAAPIFAVLAVGGLFQVMGYVYYWTFLACGLTSLQLRYSILTRTLMIALIVLGAYWGAIGVAAGVAAGLALNWVVLSLFPMRRTGLAVGPIVLTGVRASTVNIVVAAIVWLADWYLWSEMLAVARIGIGLVTAVGLYGILAALISPIRHDLLGVIRFIKKKA